MSEHPDIPQVFAAIDGVGSLFRGRRLSPEQRALVVRLVALQRLWLDFEAQGLAEPCARVEAELRTYVDQLFLLSDARVIPWGCSNRAVASVV